MPHGPYVINLLNTSVSTAITLIQYKAGASNIAAIVGARISQRGSTTSTMQPVELVRKSGAATVTSFTPLLKNTIDPAAGGAGSTSGTGTVGTAEGTDGDILAFWTPNILSGWVELPIPEGRIWVPVSGIVALKFPAAPASALTIDAQLEVVEYP